MKARIAITSGDPAGIGPEIARKAADDPRVRKVCEPVVYGPPAGSRFNAGELSAEAGRAAYEAVCTCCQRCTNRGRRGGCDRAGQQACVRPGRTAVEGAH